MQTQAPVRAVLLTVAVLLCVASLHAQTNVPIPSPEQILKTLRPGHPRLYASDQEFKALKQRLQSDARLAEWYGKVREDATRVLSQSPSKYEIPDGLRLLSTSRRVLNRIQSLGLVYRVDGDKRMVERAWKELDAAAAFPDWNPRHFLDTAEMTHAFAIGYDWFYDAWTPAQRATLKTAMVNHGLTNALGVYRGKPGRSSRWNLARHNWNQVCNGGIAVGALAIADEEPALAAELLSAGCKSIQLPMHEFAPDGAWSEGPGYWAYATIYNVGMLACLDSALGTDFGLSKIPGFSECGTFPIYTRGPSGKMFNYADASDGMVRAAQLFWLAKKFNRPDYAAYQAEAAYPGALDILWYDASFVKPSKAPLDRYFREAEVVTMRSAWNDKNALFVGFKAGDNKANHSNLDLGSFVLDYLGTRWIVDLGADNYNLPGYFGRQRWSYYRMRAESHNTLVVNPSLEPDQDPRAATKIVRYESNGDKVFAVADLTPAYARDAQQVKRGVSMLDRNRVLVQDEIKADKAADLWWFAHTGAAIEIAPDGRTATLSLDGLKLNAQLLAPANARFEKLPAAPLSTSPKPDKQNENRGIQKLAIHLPAAHETTIAVAFGKEPSRSTHKLIPLNAW